MNTTEITRLNQSSKVFTRLYKPPTPETVNAINQAKIITGIPVAMAKTTGRYNPEALLMVIGISIPK